MTEPKDFWIVSERTTRTGHNIKATSADEAKNIVLQGHDVGEELEEGDITIHSCLDKSSGRFA